MTLVSKHPVSQRRRQEIGRKGGAIENCWHDVEDRKQCAQESLRDNSQSKGRVSGHCDDD